MRWPAAPLTPSAPGAVPRCCEPSFCTGTLSVMPRSFPSTAPKKPRYEDRKPALMILPVTPARQGPRSPSRARSGHARPGRRSGFAVMAVSRRGQPGEHLPGQAIHQRHCRFTGHWGAWPLQLFTGVHDSSAIRLTATARRWRTRDRVFPCPPTLLLRWRRSRRWQLPGRPGTPGRGDRTTANPPNACVRRRAG